MDSGVIPWIAECTEEHAGRAAGFTGYEHVGYFFEACTVLRCWDVPTFNGHAQPNPCELAASYAFSGTALKVVNAPGIYRSYLVAYLLADFGNAALIIYDACNGDISERRTLCRAGSLMEGVMMAFSVQSFRLGASNLPRIHLPRHPRPRQAEISLGKGTSLPRMVVASGLLVHGQVDVADGQGWLQACAMVAVGDLALADHVSLVVALDR